ncbi:TonB-dependent receptor plug domain-containing protein, partial [Bacteroidota bacterium]
VVKGASSALYGSGAMNGVIHVRTGWAKEKPETKFRIYQGVYSNPKVESARWWDKSFAPVFTGAFFSHRRKIKNFDFVVGVHGNSDKTYLHTGHQQNIRANIKTRFKNTKVKGLSYGVNGNIQFQQSGRFILWRNDSSGAYIPLDGTFGTDKYLFSNVDPWIQYSGGTAGLHSLRMRYFRVERRNSSWENPSVSNVMYVDYRFQNDFKYNFKLIAGIQYQFIWSFSGLYRDVGTIITHNPAVFAQLEKKFGDRISLLFGIRNEWNNVPGLVKQTSLPIVRAGANFKVAKKTNIRVSFGQSFRFPSLGEKYITASLGPLRILRNTSLRAEKGWSAELGVKQGFRISGWNANFDFAMFWTEFRDMIEYKIGVHDIGEKNLVPGFKPYNLSKARIAGVEFGINGDGSIGPIPIRLFAGYTFNYPADMQADSTQRNVGVYMANFFKSLGGMDALVASNSVLKYRTTHLFKGDIELDLWKFTVGFTAEYSSFMDRIDSEFEAILPGFKSYREKHHTGVWRMDARVSFNVSKTSKVAFLSKNFLNEFYSVRPGVMEAPRSFMLQYTLNL